MSTRLTRMDAISAGDLFVLLSGDNQDYRAASAAVVMNWIESNFISPDPVTQNVTPADGFTITMTQNGTDAWLLMVPTGAIATGTITLPASTVAVDGQVAMITTTIQITTLTLDKNGATAILGAPSSMAAQSTFKLKYNALTTSWYNID